MPASALPSSNASRGTACACLGGRTFREAVVLGGNVAVRLPGGRQAHAVLAHGKKRGSRGAAPEGDTD